jgi:uracil-DNA glycosylase family 4
MPERSTPKGVSPFGLHVLKYRDGCGAPECSHRGTRVCLVGGRGGHAQLPCDVFFCGEAPGESENALGVPFVGPAGLLLDKIVAKSIPESWRVATGNLVGCIPRAPDGSKELNPSAEQVLRCAGRLADLVRLARPRLLVCVGKEAKDWLDPGYKGRVQLPRPVPQVSILHPAFILRENQANQWLRVRKTVLTLQAAVADLEAGKLVAAAEAPRPRGWKPPTEDDIPF